MLALRLAFAAALLVLPAALRAQSVAFVAGPSEELADPTIPAVLGGPANANVSLVASVLVADLADRGRPDIVIGVGLLPVIAPRQLPLRVLRATASARYADVTRELFGNGSLPSSAGPRALYAADFNRDGRLDLFCACQGYDGSPPDGERNVLLLSNAANTLEDRTSTTPTTPDYTHSAAIADIDGDGILDVYVGNIFGSSHVGPYLLRGNPDGTFTQLAHGLPADLVNLSHKYTASAFVDVDNDGYPDLVLGAEGSTTTSSLVLFNDGTGDFTKRARYMLPPGTLGNNFVALDIKLIDANNDGYWDLLVTQTQFDPNYVGGAIQLLVNQRNGTFADETRARLGEAATKTTGIAWNTTQIADLNGDGLPDILATTDFGLPGTVGMPFIWLNNGNGTFTPVSSSILSPPPQGKLVAADADGTACRTL